MLNKKRVYTPFKISFKKYKETIKASSDNKEIIKKNIIKKIQLNGMELSLVNINKYKLNTT